MSQRVDELSKQLAETEKAKTEFKSKVGILEPQCSDLEKKLRAANTRELEMKEDIRRLLEEIAHLKSSSSGTVAELQDQIAKLRAQLTQCKNYLASSTERLTAEVMGGVTCCCSGTRVSDTVTHTHTHTQS